MTRKHVKVNEHRAAGRRCGRQPARRRLRADRPRTDHRPAEHPPPLPRHHALAGGPQVHPRPLLVHRDARPAERAPQTVRRRGPPRQRPGSARRTDLLGRDDHPQRRIRPRAAADDARPPLRPRRGGIPRPHRGQPPAGHRLQAEHPDRAGRREPRTTRRRSRRATSPRRCTSAGWRSTAAPSRSSGRTATT